MKTKIILFQLCIFSTIFVSSSAMAVNADDLLITDDIGAYKYYGSSGGQGSGTIAGTGHFDVDHLDYSFTSIYFHDANEIGVNLEVTQHVGGDSDQWLLHEIEDGYRDGDYESLGLATDGSLIRNINNNNVLWIGMGGGDFLWEHTNIVIKISYTDLDGTKPEPFEVVQAYLQKYPSTIPATLVLDKAHDEQWIKDEMDRRLWLGDKWFSWQAAGNSQIPETLEEVNDHLGTFLDYREKYYGISAETEKETLYHLSSRKM